jgi:hypothetical protein
VLSKLKAERGRRERDEIHLSKTGGCQSLGSQIWFFTKATASIKNPGNPVREGHSVLLTFILWHRNCLTKAIFWGIRDMRFTRAKPFAHNNMQRAGGMAIQYCGGKSRNPSGENG